MNNSVMLWAALNGTIGLIIFILSYYFFGRKKKKKKESWGLNISWYDFGKTILVGLLVFISYYLINIIYNYEFINSLLY